MKKAAIIVAGGSGQRMGSDLPKQFLTIHGKPLFMYSIDAFINALDEVDIILVLPQAYHDFAKEIIIEAGYDMASIKIVLGGQTRFDSVKNGLNQVGDDTVVFIHDAVRCLVSSELIKRCYEGCIEKGSAIPVIPVRDSIRKLNEDGLSQLVSRENLRIVQTPQVFLGNEIKNAFNVDYNTSFTDEASVMEFAGYNVCLVEGEESNIKITYPDDLFFAEWKISKL